MNGMQEGDERFCKAKCKNGANGAEASLPPLGGTGHRVSVVCEVYNEGTPRGEGLA